MKPQTLKQITKRLASAARPQLNILREQQRGVGATLKADEAALEARKQQGFGDILQGANRRGLIFSGIPLAEQSQYLATDYLPALAGLRQGAQQERLGIRSALADLQSGIRRDALDIRERQNEMAFEARQAALDRQASAASSSGGGGGSSGGATSAQIKALQQQQLSADARELSRALQQVAGPDGFIHPDDYQSAARQFTALGYDLPTFQSLFSQFKNPYNREYFDVAGG